MDVDEDSAGRALLASDIGVGLAVLDEDGTFLFVNTVIAEAAGLSVADMVGRRVGDVRSAGRAAVIAEVLSKVKRDGLAIRSERSVYEGRTWESTYTPVDVDGRFAVAVAATDVTERETAVARADASAARHEALSALSLAALLAGDPQALFDWSLELVTSELGVEMACVLELRETRQELSVRALRGFPVPISDDAALLAGGVATLAGYTVEADGPVTVPDMTTETRFSRSGLLLENDVRSSVSVPIRAGRKVWGVLQAHTPAVRAFADADVVAMGTIGNILGAAIANEIALTEVRRLAIQRRRLIREALEAVAREQRRTGDLLHDEVLQHLLFARQELASPSASAGPEPGRVQASIGEAIGHLRTLIEDLHPVVLSKRGLSATIDSLVSSEAERGGLAVTSSVPADVSSRHDALVVTAVRELLTNVVKHAHATAVGVTIRNNGGLLLEVADDGTGLDPGAILEAVAGGHIGLASLMERVDGADGKIELTTAPDSSGALVRITLPLP
jgi:PAS domain S-box-containing protein